MGKVGRRKEDALYSACQKQDKNAVEKLLESGEWDVSNVTHKTKRTALHVAASHANLQLCNLLIAYGAVSWVPDSSGRTPAHLAIEAQSQSQNTQALQCLASFLEAASLWSDGPEKNEWLSSLLRCSTQQRSTPGVQLLLQHGASDAPHGDRQRCCLHIAAGSGELGILDALLAAHPQNAACRDITGNTPLHVASERGNASAVRSLLTVCTSPRELNSLHQTPLACALARGHAPVIEAFAEHLLFPPQAPAPPQGLLKGQPSSGQAAPARMSRHATAGRWARMSLRDDVRSVQLSAITKDVMESQINPGALVSAAEEGDFVLTQLIIDGGADVVGARRRRHGVVDVCLARIQDLREVHSFQESLVWWPKSMGAAAQGSNQHRSFQERPSSTCICCSNQRTSPVTHHRTGHERCSRSSEHASEIVNMHEEAQEPPAGCGQATCRSCWGDSVVAAQRRLVVRGLRGKNRSLDPVIDAVRGLEQLLSDLETTVLVLLAHGAPLSIELGEGPAHSSPAASAAADMHAAMCHHSAAAERDRTGPGSQGGGVGGSCDRDAGAVVATGAGYQGVSKWWLPVEAPEGLQGDSRALVAACACNSWPLVAAILTLIPSRARLHQEAVPAALAFAVGALNVPVVQELLVYAARSRHMQSFMAQDCPGVTNLLLRAATASALHACRPLQLGWKAPCGGKLSAQSSTRAAHLSSMQHAPAVGASAQSQSDEEGSFELRLPQEPLIDCVAAATPLHPPLPFAMQQIHSLACLEAAVHSCCSCQSFSSCCALSATPQQNQGRELCANGSACMQLYLYPCDESQYVDAANTTLHEMVRLGGGPGIARVSRSLEDLGGSKQQVRWQCAATMHIVDLLAKNVLQSTTSGAYACAQQSPEGDAVRMDVAGAGTAACWEEFWPIDWDAVLYVVAAASVFPRTFKPVVDQLLCLRRFWNLRACPQVFRSDRERTLSLKHVLSTLVYANPGSGQAVRAGNLFMLQRLWQYPLETVHSETGVTLLHIAAANRQPHAARFLLHCNAPYLAADCNGCNALHYFCLSRQIASLHPAGEHPWKAVCGCGALSWPQRKRSLRLLRQIESPFEFLGVQALSSDINASMLHEQPRGSSAELSDADIPLWLGEESAEAAAKPGSELPESPDGLQQPQRLSMLLRCMRDLVLLEDSRGVSPIDACVACGLRYRACLPAQGTPESTAVHLTPQSGTRIAESSAEAGGQEGALAASAAASTAATARAQEAGSAHTGRIPGVSDSERAHCMCFCSGVLWRCAVEQSLIICALLVPDALRAPQRQGGVMGVPVCKRAWTGAPGEASIVLSDLPKEVRLLICQRSCIAGGLLQ